MMTRLQMINYILKIIQKIQKKKNNDENRILLKEIDDKSIKKTILKDLQLKNLIYIKLKGNLKDF